MRQDFARLGYAEFGEALGNVFSSTDRRHFELRPDLGGNAHLIDDGEHVGAGEALRVEAD